MSGQIRQPGSVRDIKEGGTKLDAPEMVTAPSWLSDSARKEFEIMVSSLTAAEVPIKQVDSYAIGMAASCVANVAIWTERESSAQSLQDQIHCSRLIARYQADSQKWFAVIGGTPKARAQIGIKSINRKEGKLEQLLRAKNGSW